MLTKQQRVAKTRMEKAMKLVRASGKRKVVREVFNLNPKDALKRVVQEEKKGGYVANKRTAVRKK